MDHSMPMSFYFGYEHVTLLFEKWHVMGDGKQFAGMVIAVFLMGVVYEALQAAQFRFDRTYLLRTIPEKPYTAIEGNALRDLRDLPSFTWRAQIVRTTLYALSTTLSLWLMLVAMTYNAGLFIAMVAGQAVGFLFFRRGRYTSETPVNCH